MSPPTLFAHAADWISALVYLSPLALMALYIGWEKVREKRGKRPPEPEDIDEPSLDDVMDGRP